MNFIPTEETFIISDTHFGHDKIFKKEPSRLGVHTNHKKAFKHLCEQWNNTIAPYDNVLHLGDVMGKDGLAYIKNLSGKKYMILGNHDIKNNNKKLLQKNNFSIIKGIQLSSLSNAQEILLSIKPLLKGLNTYQTKLLSIIIADINGLRVLFSHYPLFDRYPKDKHILPLKKLFEYLFEITGCQLNIHGHTHSFDTKDKRCINASLDVTGYKPIKLGALLQTRYTYLR